MFGSKTRKIRDLQEQVSDTGERLQAALADAGTWKFNYERQLRGNEALEAANAALQSMLGEARARNAPTAEPTPTTADEPVERDLTGAAVRPKSQPLDLADELKRAHAHAAELEERLAVLQAAKESAYWGLAGRMGSASKTREAGAA